VNDTPWQRILATLITLGGIAVITWMETPEWQREIISRAVKRRTYRLLHRLARASGHRAMGDELAGRKSEADAGYSFTEHVSRLRDRM
jgi:hypothetical protein